MSVAYGGPPGGAGYQPPGRVNFGWIGESFNLFKANPSVWLVAALMALLPVLVGFVIGGALGAASVLHPSATGTNPFGGGTNPFGGGAGAFASPLPPALNFGIRVVTALYTAWLYSGIFQVAVKQVRGEMISTGDIFSGGPMVWRMLGFNIIYGLAVFIGTLFCFVPGFLLGGLLFPGYALIADGESVGNAVSRSFDAMKQDMWNAAAFVLIMGLLVAVSIIPCGLGLFVTLPMFFLTSALAYRDMVGMPGTGPAMPGYSAPYGTQPGVWPTAPGAWPPPPQQYPAAPPPQAYPPSEPPRRSLSGDAMDEPGQTPPGRGE